MPHNHNGQKWIRNEKRCSIYARDRFACVYCGYRGRVCLDHVDPEGGNAEDNLVTCCWACNHEKGTMKLEAWIAWRVQRGEDPRACQEMRRRVALQTFLPIDLALGLRLEAARRKGGFDFRRVGAWSDVQAWARARPVVHTAFSGVDSGPCPLFLVPRPKSRPPLRPPPTWRERPTTPSRKAIWHVSPRSGPTRRSA